MLDDNLTVSILMGATDVKVPEETVKVTAPREEKDSKLLNEVVNDQLLGELINKPVLDTLLTKLSLDKILNLSVKELLSQYSVSSLSGPWVVNNLLISAAFEFDSYKNSCRFNSALNSVTLENGITPNSLSITKVDSNWVLSVELSKYNTGDETLTATELKVLQYLNYCYTNILDSKSYYDYDYYYSEKHKQEVETLKDTNSDSPEIFTTDLLTSSLQYFSEEGKLVIKIPIAKVCNFKHPIYGEVAFTHQDLQSLKANLDNRVLGFEPPLFLGHPVDGDTIEGHPAEGFFSHYEEEDEILFGYFEVVSEETYTAVKQGKYRYSSGEFVRHYQNKNTGEDVGVVFIGMALTNRPFIPDLPRNEALSEGNNSIQNTIKNVFFLSEGLNTSSINNNSVDMKESITQEEFSSFKATVLQEVSAIKDTYAEQLKSYDQKLSDVVAASEAKLIELKTSYEQKLSETVAELSVFKTKAEYAEKQLKLSELNAKLSELNNLPLPAEVKEEYSEKLKTGVFGEQEEAVMNMLRAWGNSTASATTKQHGSQTATESLNDPSIQDPYKAVIERNLQEVKQREQKLAQLLA